LLVAIFLDCVNVGPKEALLAKCAGDTLLERAVAVQRVRESVVREAFMIKKVGRQVRAFDVDTVAGRGFPLPWSRDTGVPRMWGYWARDNGVSSQEVEGKWV
jgi:hypothetical protein